MAAARLRRPVTLVLDFDSTLTVSDTTSILGNISERSRRCFAPVVDAYVSKSNEFKARPFPWESYRRAEYSRWLNTRRDVEVSSVLLAQECQMFAGLTRRDLEIAVDHGLSTGEIQLREGWTELLRLAQESRHLGSSVSIVSVNWSGTFIRTVLCKALATDAAAAAHRASLLDYIRSIEICANEIHGLDLPDGSRGQLIRSMENADADLRTSGDKLRHFTRITAEAERLAADAGRPRPLTIYVGDSATDFECLCRADVGVWIYSVSKEEVNETFNAVFKPLKAAIPVGLSDTTADRLPKRDATADVEGPLFTWVADLPTISTFLLNRDSAE